MLRFKSTLITLIILMVFILLYSENSNPLDEMLSTPGRGDTELNSTTDQDSVKNDIIRINYAKKDARLAMFMSALVPGSGQFYADKSSITTYIFPVVEIAVIGGMIYYNGKGDDKSKDYKKFATDNVSIGSYTGPRYNRDLQHAVEDIIIPIHTADIYDGEFFSLDDVDSQHFFEDIGKYDKYIFGWIDWYRQYGELNYSGGDPVPTPQFVFSITNTADPLYNSYENKWLGNIPLDDPTSSYDPPYSPMRKEYISMREKAEDNYRVVHYLSFGLAANHILSAIDAIRVTNKVNRFYLSQSNLKMNYYASVIDGQLTPMLGLRYTF